MSTTLSPLTEADLAAIERRCTVREWPAHAWKPIAEGAVGRYCRNCRLPELIGDDELCVDEALPLSPSSALHLVAEIRRLRAALGEVSERAEKESEA